MHAAYIQYFHCLTPLHNGSGQGLGPIDRPIVRESTTGYPFIQSSTIKGAFAARAKSATNANDWTTSAFGAGEATGNQGCVLFGDASILAFPVRSLIGSFAWVTSSLALARYARLASLAGDPGKVGKLISALLADFTPLTSTKAIGASAAAGTDAWDAIISDENRYYLESLVLTSVRNDASRRSIAAIADALADLVLDSKYWKTFFRSRLVLVSDDDFTFLVHHATPVEANIRIKESGVTDVGSLRYTEFLPAESILSSLVVVELPMDKEARFSRKEDAVKVVRNLEQLVNDGDGTVQLGADESKGKGLARTVLRAGSKEDQS